MSEAVPRLRLFAGPNGSGKSTLKTLLPQKLLGVYLNPDDIEREIRIAGQLNLGGYGLEIASAEALAFFNASAFFREKGSQDPTADVRVEEQRLIFSGFEIDSYLASVAADFLRQKLLEAKRSFTLETVMSHPSKVRLLEAAQALGYRTYLYFVAIEDPAINVARVKSRVRQGGHPVPEDKVIKRYHATLELLLDAIKQTNRAYVFDNSGQSQGPTWLAEITGGTALEMKVAIWPAWFQRAVLNKMNVPPP